jgi:putative hydrolase of the HAD superfamily
MNQPKAILFDAGGTLVTIDPEQLGDLLEPILGTRPDEARMLQAHYRAMAAIADNTHLVERGAGVWWPWWLARYLEFVGLEAHPDAVEALRVSHGLWRHELPGSRSGVELVKKAGYEVAVVSNAEGHVEGDLAAAGFEGLFDVIIDSTIVGVSKPDPAIFGFALDALGVEPHEAWYVGDSRLFDQRGAEAAGLDAFVLVDPIDLHEDYPMRVSELSELLALLGDGA